MLRYLTAGESHGRALVVILEGVPAGLLVTAEDIQRGLARRRLGFGRENRFYNVLPMTYLGGFYNLLLIPILAEGSLALDGAFGVPNLYGFWENVQTFAVNTLALYWVTRAFLPGMLEPWLQDPSRTLLLTHENGVQLSPDLARIYKNRREHDPLDIDRAREIASSVDPIPVGILYRNPDVPCYEDLRHAGEARPAERIRAGLEAELDKFTVWPDEQAAEEATA